MLPISEQAAMILSRLEEKGYEAFLVGGCVRDFLMGKIPDDEDITTSATPEETKAVFEGYHIIETGLKHGTVTLMLEGTPFEITTYRTEGTYTDGRHPDAVAFTESITDDLSRRDFTVNSIAYSPKRGIVDPFGGEEDIKRGVLRCVGNPDERFTEDSLRILRAVRFASVLGFDIEKETAQAMYACTHLLKNVSAERCLVEITKMLCGKNVRDVLIKYIDILAYILPEIGSMKGFDQHNFHHIYDVLEHTAAVVEGTPPLPHLRLAALFHDCGKPDCFTLDEKGVGHFYSHASISAEKADRALQRLKSDNATRQRVTHLVRIHDTPIEPTERLIKRRLRSLGEEMFFDLITLQRADNLGQNLEYHTRQQTYDLLEDIAKKIIAEEQCFSLKDLAVDGNDLIAMGLKGKKIGNALSLLLDAVIDGKVPNDKDELLNYFMLSAQSNP